MNTYFKLGIIKKNDSDVQLDMSLKMLLKISDFTIKLSILQGEFRTRVLNSGFPRIITNGIPLKYR